MPVRLQALAATCTAYLAGSLRLNLFDRSVEADHDIVQNLRDIVGSPIFSTSNEQPDWRCQACSRRFCPLQEDIALRAA
jgi:hypothetical protein